MDLLNNQSFKSKTFKSDTSMVSTSRIPSEIRQLDNTQYILGDEFNNNSTISSSRSPSPTSSTSKIAHTPRRTDRLDTKRKILSKSQGRKDNTLDLLDDLEPRRSLHNIDYSQLDDTEYIANDLDPIEKYFDVTKVPIKTKGKFSQYSKFNEFLDYPCCIKPVDSNKQFHLIGYTNGKSSICKISLSKNIITKMTPLAQSKNHKK